MTPFMLNSNSVEVGVTPEGGHLFPVKFKFPDQVVEPMNVSAWENEAFTEPIPPMLRMLRGDFFAAPFGASDVTPDEERPHGTTANSKWTLQNADPEKLRLRLDKKVMGAEVFKEISVRPNESVIYQKHILKGGTGKLPVGHHAMLKLSSPCLLSFSAWQYAGTPPEPIESDPKLGRSLLKYPQNIVDLTRVKCEDGTGVDLTHYPVYPGFEDLWMLVADTSLPFSWSAVANPEEGWVWFSLKNPRILPNTVVWQSNGGRFYPPFSSRHTQVLGIEETVSNFHLGHRASIEQNSLQRQGFRTYLGLSGKKKITIPYIFGLVQITKSFNKVKKIEQTPTGIKITDINDRSIQTNVNLEFLTKE